MRCSDQNAVGGNSHFLFDPLTHACGISDLPNLGDQSRRRRTAAEHERAHVDMVVNLFQRLPPRVRQAREIRGRDVDFGNAYAQRGALGRRCRPRQGNMPGDSEQQAGSRDFRNLIIAWSPRLRTTHHFQHPVHDAWLRATSLAVRGLRSTACRRPHRRAGIRCGQFTMVTIIVFVKGDSLFRCQ